MPNWIAPRLFYGPTNALSDEGLLINQKLVGVKKALNKILNNTTIKLKDKIETQLGELKAYIIKRSEYGWQFDKQLENRCDYLLDFCAAVKNDNKEDVMALLSNEQIRPFIGHFSQKLFDILVSMRESLTSSHNHSPGR